MACKIYQCKYCGTKKVLSGTQIPLKTKCPKRPGTGTHVWVRVK